MRMLVEDSRIREHRDDQDGDKGNEHAQNHFHHIARALSVATTTTPGSAGIVLRGIRRCIGRIRLARGIMRAIS